MAVQLFGNANNLQGSGGVQQAGNPMQTGNPQQQYTPTATVPKPVAAPRATQPRVVAPKATPQVQPVQISQTFAPYVQTRPSPSNPGVLEYFNPQNGNGFEKENDVYNYIRTMTGQSITDLKQLEESSGIGQNYGGNINTPITPVDPAQNLATLAGGAGIGYEDYLKLIQNQNGLSLEEKERIKQGLGIPNLESEIFKPAPSTESLYSTAFKSAGLGDLKSKIEAKLDEVNRIQSAYTGKSGDINENPWLSDASRTGRLRVLDDKRLQEIGNLNSQLSSMKELYNAGVNEVNNLVTRQSTDFSNNQQLNSLKLQYLQGKAEEQISSKESEKTSAAYSYLPDYLKAKAASQKPDTIGSNETGFYRWDPATLTFQQVVGAQVTPNFSVNPITGEYFDTKTGLTQGGTLPTVAGKPATDAQNQAAGYATRVQQSTSIIDGLESAIKGYNWAGFEAQMRLPSSAQSSTIQSYNQAARNFINSVLRRESGAAIAASEFDSAYAQYLPKPGDSTQVLDQKRQNRNTVLQSLVNSAGPALGGSSGGGIDVNNILNILNGGSGFNSAGNASASTPYLKTLGAVTGLNGSSAWANGLDVDLKKGDPVRSPVSGTVIAAAPNGGFGNQIKIRTSDGREVWLSHLDSGSVKVGQKVNTGQIIAIGGNTGTTIPGKGGDGSHLDITVKDSNGKLLTAPQVKSYLDKIYV